MRKLLAGLMLAALATTTAAAQSWHTALGVQGGFSRLKLAGTGRNDAFDVYGVPSTSLLGVFPTAGGMFAILPLKDKIALEPSWTFDQTNGIGGGVPATFASLGLRADYAITPQIYGALGLYGFYSTTTGGPHEALQPGLEAAVGYQLHLGPSLEGRVEAQVVTVKKTTDNRPFNTYSLLFGLSSPMSGGAARGGRAPARAAGAWSTSIGVAGGYYQVHINGGGDATLMSFPGGGSSHAVGALIAAATPNLFVLFPVADRLALEIGADGQDIRANGATLFTFSVDPRLDLAFGPHWYGAAGPTLHFERSAPGPTSAIAGLALAWGTRFHLGGAVNGRVEANYSLTAKRNQAPVSTNLPTGAFGITFGVMFPLH
ncbi:MAG TPA: hypothetical protein VI160_06265 [Gemmatimonadales bacterium]